MIKQIITKRKEMKEERKRNKYIKLLAKRISAFDLNYLDNENQSLEKKKTHNTGGDLINIHSEFKDDKYDIRIIHNLEINHASTHSRVVICIKDFLVYSNEFVFLSMDSQKTVVAILEKIIEDYDAEAGISDIKERRDFSEQRREVERFLLNMNITRN